MILSPCIDDDFDDTHIWFELSGLPVEGVGQLPGGHDGDVHRQKHRHHQEQLRVLHHLIILVKIIILVMFCLDLMFIAIKHNVSLLQQCDIKC